MKQILQNLGSGETMLAEVPAPGVQSGSLLIRTRTSLISLGTERMLVEFGRASLLAKARQQPERVREVLAKIRSEGLFPTIEAIRAKLDQPIPLGYCNVGEVIAVGSGVEDIRPGSRVLSNGPHAEVVSVPRLLCAPVPEGVTDDTATFAVPGSIALQGLRLLGPTLGESVAVIGLGLIGLLAVQLLRASGCRVLGLDFDPAKTALAEKFGASTLTITEGADVVAAAANWSGGRGVDGVLITAATRSSEPVNQAARMCRQRGRVVLVGVAGLELKRADFYEKEISFQVSCSYGPGRYDGAYERKGLDYPYGLVRWTENRNFEAVLEAMAAGAVDPVPLISQRVPFADALDAYAGINRSGILGIVLQYPLPAPSAPTSSIATRTIEIPPSERNPATVKAPSTGQSLAAGLLGAGQFAVRTLLPAWPGTGLIRHTIVSAGGASAATAGRKFGFRRASTDPNEVLGNSDIPVVLIATRHDTHARYAAAALRAGQHVFVEKPLALNAGELEEVKQAWLNSRRTDGTGPVLMVGYNRRFAPLARQLKDRLSRLGQPICVSYLVNAGAVPANHWTRDGESGGGRLIGEGCHFIDFLRFLVGHPIISLKVSPFGSQTGSQADTATLQMTFADGSIGTVHYWANGHKAFPKERVEVFGGGRLWQLDNFRVLRSFGDRPARTALWHADKGHTAELAAFAAACRGRQATPIPIVEIWEIQEQLNNLGT